MKGDTEGILGILEERFKTHMKRHEGLDWDGFRLRLAENGEKLAALARMEESGGEPDAIGTDPKTGEYLVCDCAPESPAGRRSLCYDREALDGRKTNKPASSALDVAREIGVELLDEGEYRALQALGEFDLKTSSWVKTPEDVRSRGGALFCDRRYGRVFTYHNGAESYYSARGFRGILRV